MKLKLSILALSLIISSCVYLSEIIKKDPFVLESNNKEKTYFKSFDHSENKNEYKFVAVGDAGSGFKSQYDVAKAIEEKCKNNNCDFVLYLGDNFYDYGVKSIDDYHFKTKFEYPYKNINLTFYVTLGNHDYRGDIHSQIKYSKKNKKFFLPNRTYKVKKDFIDLFSIDTNIPYDDQTKNLEDELKKSNARWKIVFGHHPRYSSGLHGDASKAVAKMLDKALCNNADFYLAGHDHHKEHAYSRCGVEYVIVGTGGASLRGVLNNKNNFSKSSYGFSWFKVTKNEIYFEFLDIDGNIEYSFKKEKL
jgi:acid phosphatase